MFKMNISDQLLFSQATWSRRMTAMNISSKHNVNNDDKDDENVVASMMMEIEM